MNKNNQQEELQFIDAEEYMGKGQGMSYKEIVLRHLGKISQICIKEFKEGYWQKKPITTSGGGMFMTEVYHEDSRDAYINAIDYYNDILLPFFDDDMKEDAEKIKEYLKDQKKEMTKDKSVATTLKNDWIDLKLEVKRELFQKLNMLLQRIGFLEQQVIDDG